MNESWLVVHRIAFPWPIHSIAHLYHCTGTTTPSAVSALIVATSPAFVSAPAAPAGYRPRSAGSPDIAHRNTQAFHVRQGSCCYQFTRIGGGLKSATAAARTRPLARCDIPGAAAGPASSPSPFVNRRLLRSFRPLANTPSFQRLLDHFGSLGSRSRPAADADTDLSRSRCWRRFNRVRVV